MTTLVVCVLAGLVPLLWPSRTRHGQSSAARSLPGPRWSREAVGPQEQSSLGGGDIRPPWRGLSRAALRRDRRQDAATAGDVADALVLVALCLRAGLPLTAALHHVQSGATGVVRDELAAVVAALRWGLPAREAWACAGDRWRHAATASHLSEQTGAASADLLEGAAERMREQGERARERAAAKAGVLLVLPLGLGFLPAFACTAVVPVVVTLASGVLDGA